jgi:hypothetical protein
MTAGAKVHLVSPVFAHEARAMLRFRWFSTDQPAKTQFFRLNSFVMTKITEISLHSISREPVARAMRLAINFGRACTHTGKKISHKTITIITIR